MLQLCAFCEILLKRFIFLRYVLLCFLSTGKPLTPWSGATGTAAGETVRGFIMKYNLWKSTYTGQIYKIPVDVDFLPKFGGWELIGTIWE